MRVHVYGVSSSERAARDSTGVVSPGNEVHRLVTKAASNGGGIDDMNVARDLRVLPLCHVQK